MFEQWALFQERVKLMRELDRLEKQNKDDEYKAKMRELNEVNRQLQGLMK